MENTNFDLTNNNLLEIFINELFKLHDSNVFYIGIVKIFEENDKLYICVKFKSKPPEGKRSFINFDNQFCLTDIIHSSQSIDEFIKYINGSLKETISEIEKGANVLYGRK